MSCGSPMPRGEQIAKPAEWDIYLAGPFLGRLGAVRVWGGARVPSRLALVSVSRVCVAQLTELAVKSQA